jgi:hypothetical protein
MFGGDAAAGAAAAPSAATPQLFAVAAYVGRAAAVDANMQPAAANTNPAAAWRTPTHLLFPASSSACGSSHHPRGGPPPSPLAPRPPAGRSAARTTPALTPLHRPPRTRRSASSRHADADVAARPENPLVPTWDFRLTAWYVRMSAVQGVQGLQQVTPAAITVIWSVPSASSSNLRQGEGAGGAGEAG